MQRLRLKFGRGAPVRFISHLDSVRCWERVFRRASIPLEYTQGFTPHPRIAVAAPLAVGVTSDAELLDIWLRKWVPPQSALMMARSQLPVGFTLLDAWEVPNGAPALQAMVQTARYECIAMHEAGVAEAHRAAEAFMQAESVVHRFSRGGEDKEVDLRRLVRGIVVRAGPDDSCRIDLEVRIGQEGSARPDHVLSELGFVEPAIAIHRAALSFELSGADTSEDCPRPR
jgi:radical SAM-linked protein